MVFWQIERSRIWTPGGLGKPSAFLDFFLQEPPRFSQKKAGEYPLEAVAKGGERQQFWNTPRRFLITKAYSPRENTSPELHPTQVRNSCRHKNRVWSSRTGSQDTTAAPWEAELQSSLSPKSLWGKGEEREKERQTTSLLNRGQFIIMDRKGRR